MAYSINKVTLFCNVGKDPEIKTFQNGGKVSFSPPQSPQNDEYLASLIAV